MREIEMPSLRLFDAHCHLEDPAFDDDRWEVIDRAVKAGVVGMVSSSLDSSDAEKALRLFLPTNVVYISLGLDPRDVDDEAEIKAVERLILENEKDIVAVGEVGMDYRIAKQESVRKRQEEVFRRFIRLAEEIDKPIVVHSLWAQRPVLRVLEDEGATRVVLHAFGGSQRDVKTAVERGWYVSIATNVTRSANVQKVAEATPVEYMVLESDSPVLSPDSKGRNEPANIVKSVKFLAKMKGMKPAELAEITTTNAMEVYGLR